MNVVYVVGAGPGASKLLTTKALEVLKRADVVLYDGLVSKEVIRLIPKHAEKMCVGRSSHNDVRLSQEEINDLMITRARSGRRVVRLKGGDPFIFSRGGEEVEALRANGIRFEVIPGVTSAISAPAYAGIPLTHRGYSSSVAIVTGHESASKNKRKVRFAKLAKNVDTLVILMGVSTLRSISGELIQAGLTPDTPAAAVEWATTARQRTTLFTLGEATRNRMGSSPHSPSVIVIGKVVCLARKLNWFRKGTLLSSKRFEALWGKENRSSDSKFGD